jgi:phosphorylase/glycogen(starch) synthase
LIDYYKKAYEIALIKAAERAELYKGKQTLDHKVFKDIVRKRPTWKKLLIRPNVPDKFIVLRDLSQNLWWTWNHDAVELFKMVSRPLWDSKAHNPIAMIEALTLEDFSRLEKDSIFMEKLELVHHKFLSYMERAAEKPKDKIAYFSMEFGIHDSLKIYSGGLGILAGDYLKEASDSNANIIGVGLLYRYGYFQQNISLLGNQIETYPPQKYSHLPLMPVRYSDNGDLSDDNWVKFKMALPGRTLLVKAWRVDVGTVPLYLLETDIKENSPEDRAITHRLYGGDNELRFKQELVLGVGGIRLLEIIGIKPTIYHCNEGHAAFIGVERIRKYVHEDNLSFHQALEVVRASQLFTTHTPVPAGHDTFPEDILRTYVAHFPERMNLTWDNFMNLGKINENDPSEKFSMSVLAAKLSSEMNGVSKIHGRVTREMFANLYTGYFTEELHIGYVTNGVHFPTWVGAPWKKLYDSVFDTKYYYDQTNKEYWNKIQDVDDQEIWNIRNELRSRLIDRITKRLEKEMTQRQENPKLFFKIKQTISDKKLTIGFARRFATYKRANLLFMNLERLDKIVNNAKCPVQFIFAGKAHPNDKAGQDLIKMIYEISHRPEFIGKIIILENYDIQLSKYLTQGVDIWLNTPTRPLEASGTSGEKAIMNGVVNFSVLDGWWAEGYKPEAGWSLQEERTYQNQGIQDELDVETIYNILEDEIIPTYYELNSKGLPEKWISYVKNTISQIAPDFTMRRMLLDYQEKYYKKLITRANVFYENHYELACILSAWKQRLLRGWDSIEVFYYNVTQCEKRPLALGENFEAEIVLDMNELSGTDIGIEIIFAHSVDGQMEKIIYKEEMQMTKIEGTHVTFKCSIPADRVGVFDYAFRVFPKHPLLAHRQDFNLVEWL